METLFSNLYSNTDITPCLTHIGTEGFLFETIANLPNGRFGMGIWLKGEDIGGLFQSDERKNPSNLFILWQFAP